jgi:DnaJ-class molecular chaperone
MSRDNDPKGYYACLGVAPNASSEEIKSSYKQLAKKLHPDINRDSNANSLFQKINNAYQILSDPDSRSAYDSLQYSKPRIEPSPNELDPICCSHCGKVTAQPRSTVFFKTVSFLFYTTKTPVQGIFLFCLRH